MANKNIFRLVLIFVLILFFYESLFADAEKIGESLSKGEKSSEEENTAETVEDSWQFLEWESVDTDFVLYYVVTVEKYDSKKGEFEQILEKQTDSAETKIAIRPKLSPGKYRYKVVTFDLLGMVANESDWFDFLIVQAFQPKISGVSSEVNGTSTLYLEEYNNGVFNIDGRNLFLPKKSNVEDEITGGHTAYKLKNRKTGAVAIPEILGHEESNRKIKIKFEMDFLTQGVYELSALDASGLESERDKNSIITVKFKKRYDFNISAFYALPMVVYDSTFPDFMGSSVFPAGAGAKATFIFSKHNFGYFGAGFNAHYNYMTFEKTVYKITGNTIDGYLNFVYQLPIYKVSKNGENIKKRLMTLEVRLGFGLLMFGDFEFEFSNGVKSDPFNSINLSAQLGLNAQFFITSRFFMEAGFDFVNAFTSEMSFGEFIPTVGLGWQF